ncbi:MAG: hypothetical protein EOO77_22415 [Oxalobacteraceae bacterium]|nr:MAG: hypothetical protein EOO77_22415 [Oxalobacteraceae bacterium]
MTRCRIKMPDGETLLASVILLQPKHRVLALTDVDEENWACVVLGIREEGDPADLFRVTREALFPIDRDVFDATHFLDMWALGKK